MSHNPKKTVTDLGILIQILEEEIDSLSTEELLNEAAKEDGGVAEISANFDSIFEAAENNVKHQRFLKAKEGYQKATQHDENAKPSDNVLMWAIDKKKVLLAKVYERNNSITMAARNDEDSESDIDSILEDLIALGAIDSQGNPT